jgi:hypothetical protein
MKIKHYAGGALLLMVALLPGCGGGGTDTAGSATEFSTVPTELTLTGSTPDTCAGGPAGRVFVYGGAGPYRIDNTQPGLVAVSAVTIVGPSSGYFDVVFLTNTCMESISVTVVDVTGRTTIVDLNSEPGEEEEGGG